MSQELASPLGGVVEAGDEVEYYEWTGSEFVVHLAVYESTDHWINHPQHS